MIETTILHAHAIHRPTQRNHRTDYISVILTSTLRIFIQNTSVCVVDRAYFCVLARNVRLCARIILLHDDLR